MTSQMNLHKRLHGSDDVPNQAFSHKHARLSYPGIAPTGAMCTTVVPALDLPEQVLGPMITPLYSAQHGLYPSAPPLYQNPDPQAYGISGGGFWPQFGAGGQHVSMGQLYTAHNVMSRTNPQLPYQGPHRTQSAPNLPQLSDGMTFPANLPVPAPQRPPSAGFPSITDFNRIVQDYIESLSPKKRDKALITEDRYHKIRKVHTNMKDTTIDSAQFRFWAKKMFDFNERTGEVLHEHKPVATRERLYSILCRAHDECQHGGRDKTSAQVHKEFSWVPKELIARFVRECPSCQKRRSSPLPKKPQSPCTPRPLRTPSFTGQATPPVSDDSATTSPAGFSGHSATFASSATMPYTLSPPASRRTSLVASATTAAQFQAYTQALACQTELQHSLNNMNGNNTQVSDLQLSHVQPALGFTFGESFGADPLQPLNIYEQHDASSTVQLQSNGRGSMRNPHAFGGPLPNHSI